MKTPIFTSSNHNPFALDYQAITNRYLIHRFMSHPFNINLLFEKFKNHLNNNLWASINYNQGINTNFIDKYQLNNIHYILFQEIYFICFNLYLNINIFIAINDSKPNNKNNLNKNNNFHNYSNCSGSDSNNANNGNNNDTDNSTNKNNDDSKNSNSDNTNNNSNSGSSDNNTSNDDDRNNNSSNDNSNNNNSIDSNNNNNDDDKNKNKHTNDGNNSSDNDNKNNLKKRKSSVAIFVPSMMISRMSDELLKSSQELLYSSKSNLDEKLFSDHSFTSMDSELMHDQKIIEKDIDFKSNQEINELQESEDEFEKIFMPVEEDHLIKLEECQSIDENFDKNLEKNDDLTVLFNSEKLQESNSLLDSNNSYLVDEGPFTMDCIKISEAMNDALEIITARRKEDIEPFNMKMKETTAACREKIENNHKKYDCLMKSKFESIKNSHKTNLKVFKEKETIIHYKLNEIDSSFAEMALKFENVQSFLREQIQKNKVFLERKINELRESLKYAC